MKLYLYLYTVFCLSAAAGCSYPKNFTKDFYQSNETKIIALKEEYTKQYNEKPFAILFEDRTFKNIGFEIITDSIRYIYHFNIEEPAFSDTLSRYGYSTPKMLMLVDNLRKIQCTWITKVDYYENYAERHLLLMAIRNKALNHTFKGESYCTLAFFDRPQPVDEEGKFLDRANRKRRRMINDYELRRINDQVSYAITRHYR